MLYDRRFTETSAVVAAAGRGGTGAGRQRLRGSPWRLNAEIPGAELRRSFPPSLGRCGRWTARWNSAR